MRRTVSFFSGVFAGALVGAVAALLLAPSSGEELQKQVRSNVEDLIEQGKQAAAARQKELEQQLASFKKGKAVEVEEAETTA
jgi:gas vesicle protein